MTGSTAALVSFAESSALLHELAGVEVSVKQVERAAEALGAEIAADERACVEKMGEVAPTMYLGMDGTGVPMRATEVAGRAGKQSDGSAKTREAKLVTIWTAESRDAEDKPMRDPGSITYSAAIESAAISDTSPNRSDFAERVLREATRRSFTQAAQSIFGATGEGQPWATARCTELDDGQLRAIVHALRSHAASSAEAAKCALYIFRNRARMRYPKFHAQGLCVSVRATASMHRPLSVLKWNHGGIGKAASQAQEPNGS